MLVQVTSVLGRLAAVGCFDLADREFPSKFHAETAVRDLLAHALLPECPKQPAACEAEAAQMLAEACWGAALPYAETVSRLDEQVRCLHDSPCC